MKRKFKATEGTEQKEIFVSLKLGMPVTKVYTGKGQLSALEDFPTELAGSILVPYLGARCIFRLLGTSHPMRTIMIATVTRLSMRYLHFTPGRLGSLRQLPLEHLDLRGCNVTDAELVHLHALPLQHLSFSWDTVSDVGLAHLRQLPLQHLALNNCVNLTDAGLYTYVNYGCSTWSCMAATS